jgi:hypothetical protein
MNITELEKQVLINIKNSEYQDGSSLENSWVWSFSVTNETKQLSGALGSCVKKGLVVCDMDDTGNGKPDEVCSLTKEGVEYLNIIGEKTW